MQNDPPLRIAKVDATAETAVAGRFDVAGYPSLLVGSFRRALLNGVALTRCCLSWCSVRVRLSCGEVRRPARDG